MALTVGSGPFGPSPRGTVTSGDDGRFRLVEPFGRRVRATKEGRVVIDSDDVSLVHVSGSLPRYSFPSGDVRVEAKPDPDVPGNVRVAWSAVDAWFEEDERVFVHPRDPYHRCDTVPTSRRVEVRLGHVELAATTRAHALYETSLPARWYIPRVDVRFEHLHRSNTVTECPYKGTAHYWSAVLGGGSHGNGGSSGNSEGSGRAGNGAGDLAGAGEVTDVAWSYEEDTHGEGLAVQWLLAFDDSKVELYVDGMRQG